MTFLFRISNRLFTRFYLLLLVWIHFIACGGIDGQFGWASRDNRGITEPERSLLVETEFRIEDKALYFYDYETIWWIYQITGGMYFDDGFLVALYENNNTPHPVLLDLRKPHLSSGDCCDYIRYYYEDLKVGRYLLRIAYDSQVIDEAGFFVLPSKDVTDSTTSLW